MQKRREKGDLGLLPLFLHAASNQKLEVGKAWELSYTYNGLHVFDATFSNVLHNYIIITSQLCHNYITITSQLHHNYITITS